MNNTTVGIAAAGIGLAAGLAVGLPCFLEPSYGIILRASNADINDGQWQNIETQVLNRPTPVNQGVDRGMLYRVRKFENGDPVPAGGTDEGTLDKTALLEDYDATITDLKTSGFTGHAFQIGLGTMKRSKRIPKTGTDSLHAHHQLNILESKEMVKEVDDILNGQ